MNIKYGSHHGQLSKAQVPNSPAHVRPANVFQDLPLYPVPPHNGIPSLPPQLHDNMNGRLGGHIGATIPASATITTPIAPGLSNTAIRSLPPARAQGHGSPLPTLAPEAKKRKLFTVRDLEKNIPVRVKINLEGINVNEMPDPYRREHSIYPRAFSPVGMKLSPRTRKAERREQRFIDEEDNEEGLDDDMGIGQTTVKVPMVDGREGDISVPRLGRRQLEKEKMLNDLGYRICWGHGRSFSRRILLIQRTGKLAAD